MRADLVVSNADLPYTYRKLIAPADRKDYTDQRLERMRYACSGFILYLGVNKTYSHLRHQALYFSEDYRANLDAIFKTKVLPVSGIRELLRVKTHPIILHGNPGDAVISF